MGKDDALPLAAGNAEVGFPRFARAVDDTAHDGDLDGDGQMRNGLFDFLGQVDEVDLGPATARAGNVIGGGDFANDRIIPDCIRAAMKHEDIVVRNPFSTRPYQHVLEPLYAYLMIAAMQYENGKYAGYYNVGPDDVDCFQTGALVDLFVSKWGEGLKWINKYDGGPHEANFLKLDCSKLKTTFGWKPRWTVSEALDKTVEWTKAYFAGENVAEVMNQQIQEFLSE